MAKLSPTDEGRQDFGPVIALEASHDDITMGFTTFKEQTDMTPILASLPSKSCQCPHWGVLTKGRATVRYDDGSAEVIEPGDAYYMTRGHVPVFEAGTELVMFSPADELKATDEAIQAYLGAAQGT
ncbi:MAG: hypothetical protein JWR06_2721 [Jatrophihabitans sp.]|jgi:hypothetical protein|nr:hypothetical protein [Jatrophihabitans sp.]MCW2658528.1 hypothetical protein [Jatrophihabitans sp.]MDT4904559.1 hypothetical protein [Pseudonocardiales bacterium]MDT4931882.1 hypothetical protein [Pseudonocardiales bacterium]